ncbi:hypothetical protein [Priestia megaterium]|uniref:hypothetical protein n=1 Tax=Priestia megaterium TaxID=1404 RepID=UPI0015CEFBC9|nr:hypothetical protein [Priestia megaterium]
MTGLRSVTVLTVLNHFHSLWCSSAAWVANGGDGKITNIKIACINDYLVIIDTGFMFW